MKKLVPFFPLELVVYPGEQLNLHIFEPRYKQLIHDCASEKSAFGIPSVVEKEIPGLGTLVELLEITEVHANGEMDIKTRGLKVFHVEQLVKLVPGKLYSGGVLEYPETNDTGDAELMGEVLAAVKALHAILKVEKKFGRAESRLRSYDVAHHAGLSLKQEYELLALFDERERQQYLQRHLKKLLPVAAEVEALKEKVKLNGHFKNLPGFDF